MDSSPPRYRPLQQPLTLENVGVIPSTKPSIDAFIREQRLNSRFYAEEAALEGKGSKACNPRQSESSQRKGLTSSPLLRPRIGIQQENDLASIKQVVSKVKDSERNTTEPKRRQDVARKELFYGSAFPETSRSRKRAKQPLPPSDNDDDDDDRINRLKERRERKRLRRSIMKEKKTPEDVSDIFQESEGEVETVTNSKKKSRGRKSKLPSGIAMMEAFTAANVKGSRLTLKPKHGGTVFKHAKSGVTIALSGKQDKQSSSKSVQKRRQSIKHLGYGRPGSSKDKATRALKDKLLAQLLSESSDRTSTSSFDSIAEESLTQNDVLARNGSPMEEETKGRSSQSWGIGSALPSEDQSIQEEHRPQYMASSSKEKVITPSRSSESVIMAIPTCWNFVERVTSQHKASGENDKEPSQMALDLPQGVNPPTSLSKYFFSPLVSIPPHIQISQALSHPEVAPHENRVIKCSNSVEDPATICLADQQPEPLAVHDPIEVDSQGRSPSSNSLDNMLHEYDVEEVLYGWTLAVNQSKQLSIHTEYSGTDYELHSGDNEQIYGDYPQESIPSGDYQEPLGCDGFYNHEGENSFGNDIDDALQNGCWDSHGCHEDEGGCNDRFMEETSDQIQYRLNGGDAGESECEWICDDERGSSYAIQQSGFDMGMEDENSQYGPTPAYSDLQEQLAIDEEGDLLPLATGRLLLFGIDASQTLMGAKHTTTFNQDGGSFVSAYGQSVQEIEVGVGKHLVKG